jgi:hypothetical protein
VLALAILPPKAAQLPSKTAKRGCLICIIVSCYFVVNIRRLE